MGFLSELRKKLFQNMKCLNIYFIIFAVIFNFFGVSEFFFNSGGLSLHDIKPIQYVY